MCETRQISDEKISLHILSMSDVKLEEEHEKV